MNDEFYIGYESKAPSKIARWIRRAVLAAASLALLLAIILVAAQAPFAPSRFEFGVVRDYEGEILEWPYPMLQTRQGAYLLVSTGKFGAAPLVSGKEGQLARLRGTLVQRGQDRMIQVESDSIHFYSPAGEPSPAHVDLGSVHLTGEIVDTKCFLGVMNPGNGKVHRDCAVRCISGGVPPGFLVRDASGDARVILLVGSDGRQIGREVLDFVAEPVTIEGRLVRAGSTLILHAEPREFRRE